jgi:Ca2+-binding RTX toxin-like protein
MVNLIKHDLTFILKQIRIAEAHAEGGDLKKLVGEAGLAGTAGGTSLQPHLLPYGLRTVDGTYNNLLDGQESWGASDQPFKWLTSPVFRNEEDDEFAYVPNGNNDYGAPGNVVDADPRLISNLIVDQTSNNPAARAVAQQLRDAGYEVAETPLLKDGNAVIGADGEPVVVYTFENISPDIGDSAPYNGIFTLFGQFFDHGLDLVGKGGNGTVYIPLKEDDPLYDPLSPHTNFMALTRATPDATNVTTPWVDQNQTYTSHPSHQVFLREYVLHEGRPVATGHLLEGDMGLATWADVKEQARTILGIDLTDVDVSSVPLLRTDPYGNFIPDPVTGFPQLVLDVGPDGIPNTADDVVASGTPDAPVSTLDAARVANAFLDDIAHAAVPVFSAPDPVTQARTLLADDDDVTGYSGGFNTRGQQTAYDNEMLDAHYITGDGRGNENVGLTAIHHIFHSEHNRVVEHAKSVILESGDLPFLNEWLLEPISEMPASQAEIDALVWNGERLFQAGRFTTEMEYQHLVFEEFGRKMQPDIDVFNFEPSADIDPAVFAEFAHAVYRFGHSMLNESIDTIDADGTVGKMSLFDGFLNPLALGALDAEGNVIVDHDTASAAIIRGMSRQGGNEIDEFVTDVLRNQLTGIPLDLPALNLARGRDVGLPSLNETRAQFFQLSGQDSQLKPYESWTDFALNLKNPVSIVNFIAAYGTHDSIVQADTIDAKREAADLLVLGGPGAPADREDFLNSRGVWSNTETGLNDVDLWMGGVAEKKMDFGGMLGSTFSFVFEMQMENLQDGDRFYYLSRVQGLNLLNELENNSLAKMMMANTDLGDEGSTSLPGDIFSSPDHTLEMDPSRQVGEDPEFSDPVLNALTPLVVREDIDGDGDNDVLIYNGEEHVVLGGSEEDDLLAGGEGDDSIWGRGGNDDIEAGYGVDHVHGGEGDDIITNSGTDIGMADFLHGEAGNDVIHGGSGMALIFGNEGQDFIISGPDGKHSLGGLGTDFVRGGDGMDFVMGNEGDDWLEGGGRFDTLAGENSELFFNSSIIGHDVLNGNGNDTDYDAESGDDIMFQNEGIQRSNGMAGFDWAIHKGDSNAANSDLGIPLFDTQEAFILRDRFDLVEGLSGWEHDDVLTGRVEPTNARAELQNTAAIPGEDSVLDSYSNALLEKNVALIDGLDELVAHRERTSVTVAGVTEEIVIDTADASDILLGGGGSDVITGLAGDDIIDGDRWLNVRIRVNDSDGNEIGSADGMTEVVYDSEGNELFGGRTLDALMFDRTLNPGDLGIVREILDGDVAGDVDVAAYTDVMENYTISRNADGSITVEHSGFDQDALPDADEETVTRPVSDGTDRLFNIEVLRFSDGNGGTVDYEIDDLIASPAVGMPVISDMTPTEGWPLTVDTSSIQDENGLGAFAYQWQSSSDNGDTWVDIAGAVFPAFTPTDSPSGQVGSLLRVSVSFIDGDGNPETLLSEPTAVVGDYWTGTFGVPNTFIGTEGADIANGQNLADRLAGNGGDDQLNGGGGNDTAVFAGAVQDYTLESNGTVITVTDNTGVEGVDTLTGIELLEFNDVSFRVVNGTSGNNTALNGAAGANGSQIVFGLAGADTINGGAGRDIINAGDGSDTIIQTGSTGNRDFVDGGAGVDTYQVQGVTASETFTIYSRAEALAAIEGQSLTVNAGATLNANTEIVVARNGVLIAELDNIEEIRVNSFQVTSPGGANGGSYSGDTIQVVGDFTETSLNFSTITIDGSQDDDVVDISSLQSAHRIVFRSQGGNDVIVGMLREQDVIELPEGADLSEYETETVDGMTRLTSAEHSITFASEGTPQIVVGGSRGDDDNHGGGHPGGGHGDDDDHHGHDDDDHDDDDDQDDDDHHGHDDDDQDDDDHHGHDDHDDDHHHGHDDDDPRDDEGAGDGQHGEDDEDDDAGDAKGTSGDDSLSGGSDDDTLDGKSGDDMLRGGSGDDTLYGGSGDDTLHGGSGDDDLKGGSGDDVLEGGSGDDSLKGGSGDDALHGGSGDDILVGGSGDDMLTGGSGDDVFAFGDGDTVTDFGAGDDLIDLRALGVTAGSFSSRVSFSSVEDDLLLSIGDSSMRLEGVGLDALDVEAFVLADDGMGTPDAAFRASATDDYLLS